MAGAEMAAQMLDEQLRDVRFVEVGEETDGDSRRPMVKCCRSQSFSSPALLLAMAFIGLCIVLTVLSVMSFFSAPTFQSVGHYRASDLIFVDPTELEAMENRLKCHLQPKTYRRSPKVSPPVMVLSSTDGTVVAMSHPQRQKFSQFSPYYRWMNEFLIDLDEKLDFRAGGSFRDAWARATWITGRSASFRDILTMIGGCDTTALPAKKLILMGGRKFFQPDVRLPMPAYADHSPGFEDNSAEMQPRFNAIQSYLRCHVHKTKCTACCTSLPLSLCDKNSLIECTTAVVTITDKLGLLQAWGAKPLPQNWSDQWLHEFDQWQKFLA